MDPPEIDKLAEKGFLVDLPQDRKGVPVSIQYRPNLHAKSRSERKEELAHSLASIVKLIQSMGGVVDIDSLSISGQTINCIVPAERYSDVLKELGGQDALRLDLLLNQQVL